MLQTRWMAGLPSSTAHWGGGLQLEGVSCPARGAEPLERMPRLGFGSTDTAPLGVGARVPELWVGAGVSAAAEGGRRLGLPARSGSSCCRAWWTECLLWSGHHAQRPRATFWVLTMNPQGTRDDRDD